MVFVSLGSLLDSDEETFSVYYFLNLVSFLMPAFLYVKPIRCCFYGDISSKGDPESYLNSLFLLYNYFVEKYRCPGSEVLPLIVNTPGWVKGIY